MSQNATYSRRLLLIVTAAVLTACATPGANPDYDKNGKPIKVTQTARGVQITSDERVLFETGKSTVRSEGAAFIERVANIVKNKSKANVAVEGHTDNVGGAAYNQQLSERRANAVKAALIQQGVPAARIQTQGLGMTRPVGDNGTADGRQANRRTEIILLGENEANISGGLDLADMFNEGLQRFLGGANTFIGNVFGGDKPK